MTDSPLSSGDAKQEAGRAPPKEAEYQEALAAFCAEAEQIASTLDFRVSSRGWAYIFENRGLITKDDLDTCQSLINDCRKSGDLPLDICAIDETRAFEGLEEIDDESPKERAATVVNYVHRAHLTYWPVSFWEDQDYYVQMVVEKIDLKSLFAPVCAEFRVPIANAKGWSDLNLRADMMRRFDEWESKGKECALLYCGDHDPAGLNISDFLRSNMEDLADAVGWSPENVHIDRFGLNKDFIDANHLTWIDNLISGSKVCLGNDGSPGKRPKHPDHDKSYVQSYIARFGVRKVEANALVVAPEAGRALCRQAIFRYVDEDAPDAYMDKLDSERDEMRDEIRRLLAEGREE